MLQPLLTPESAACFLALVHRSTPPRIAAVCIIDNEITFADMEPDQLVMKQFRARNDNQIASLEMLAIAFGMYSWMHQHCQLCMQSPLLCRTLNLCRSIARSQRGSPWTIPLPSTACVRAVPGLLITRAWSTPYGKPLDPCETFTVALRVRFASGQWRWS